jgi:hypothetical protein
MRFELPFAALALTGCLSISDQTSQDAGTGDGGSVAVGGSGWAGTGGGGGADSGLGGSAANGAGGTSSCTIDQKLCATECVSKSDPQFGCVGTDCSPCSFTQASVTGCDTSGTCTIIKCNSGYGDCDGDANDGCETDLGSDPDNCGACNNGCNSSNATPSCVSSTCQLNCNSGYGNCDGNVANGCETNLQADTANCGSCGHGCGSHGCKNGSCCGLVAQDCSNISCCNSGKCDNLSFGGLSGKYCTG